MLCHFIKTVLGEEHMYWLSKANASSSNALIRNPVAGCDRVVAGCDRACRGLRQGNPVATRTVGWGVGCASQDTQYVCCSDISFK